MVNRAQRPDRRHFLDSGRHPRRRDGAIVIGLLLLPWAAALVLTRGFRLDDGTLAILVAVSFGLASLWVMWVTYRGPKRSGALANGLSMTQIADHLAIAVGTQWSDEAAVRRLNDPYPLPVSWTAADAFLTDSWNSLVALASLGAGRPPSPPPGTWAACPDDLAGKGSELAEVLTKVPTGRLVVLGEPGAGKTMLMVRLVLDMLARRNEGGPIPILVSLASWNPAAQDLQDWLSTQLRIDHPALDGPPPAGREEPTLVAALLADGLILPILDGLDEIPAEARGPAITRINDTLRPGQQFVLTCRSKEYRDAVRPEGGVEITLRAAAAVQLCPLEADAVRHYLCDDAGGPVAMARWDPVLAMLGTEAPVGQALSTPLMVSLARAIYNPRPGELAASVPNPEELCNPDLSEREAVESRLFDAFIPAAYRQATAGRWKLRQAETWLTALAIYLEHAIGEPNFAWWQLSYEGSSESSQGFVLRIAARRNSKRTPALGARIRPIGLTLGLVAGLEAAVIVGLGLLNERWLWLLGSPPGKVSTGLAASIVAGFGFGLTITLALGVVGAPSDLTGVTSPRTVLARDRQVALLFVLIGGLAIGLFSAVVHPLPAGSASLTAIRLAPAVGFGVCVGFGLSAFKTLWPSYIFARGVLATSGLLPWSIMGFLEDAHRRGVLRQVGAVYQFRHIELQHRLANRVTSGEEMNSPPILPAEKA